MFHIFFTLLVCVWDKERERERDRAHNCNNYSNFQLVYCSVAIAVADGGDDDDAAEFQHRVRFKNKIGIAIFSGQVFWVSLMLLVLFIPVSVLV